MNIFKPDPSDDNKVFRNVMIICLSSLLITLFWAIVTTTIVIIFKLKPEISSFVTIIMGLSGTMGTIIIGYMGFSNKKKT